MAGFKPKAEALYNKINEYWHRIGVAQHLDVNAMMKDQVVRNVKNSTSKVRSQKLFIVTSSSKRTIDAHLPSSISLSSLPYTKHRTSSSRCIALNPSFRYAYHYFFSPRNNPVNSELVISNKK